MFNLFGKKKNDTGLRTFIQSTKAGSRDFLQILNKNPSVFQESSFDELLSNEDDVLAQVNRVQKCFSETFFQLFDGCLIKHHDNGDIKYVFYTTTNKADKVIETAGILLEELGHGQHNSPHSTSCTNQDKIITLSKGKFENESDDIRHYWRMEDISFVLQYRTSPLQQFSLMITICQPKVLDKEVKRNGTILNLITLDLDELLATKEVLIQKEEVDGKIKFVDYWLLIIPSILDMFDVIKVRIFGDQRTFDKTVQTHVFLSTQEASADDKIEVSEKLIRMYGLDNGGSGEIQLYERDILESNGYWTGRSWDFNEMHSLANTSPNTPQSYSVRINNNEEAGFSIAILSYNQLVDLFGLS